MDVRLLGEATRELADLHRLKQNYTLDEAPTAAGGWTLDDYVQRLPKGSFEVAKEFVRNYEFADPAIIKAVWLPDSPLQERDMQLEGRFLFLRFLIGVRVNRVVDEERVVDGRPQRAWGWCYTTLQGHFEAGEMCYEVEQWLDTDEVQFHVHRFVRTGQIPNPLIRLGWRTFGRFMQVLFVRRSMGRMKRLVETAMTRQDASVPLAARQITVGKASERLAE
ncbi:MAG: hypothetical protein JWN55_688 [Frankiales bacterium]|nr:hypothetical protein [Frankiales bacterium]